MAARKTQNLPSYCATATHHTIRPSCDFLCRSPRNSHRGPVRAFLKDVNRQAALILTVVPFDEIAVDVEESFIRNPNSSSCPTHLTGRQLEIRQMLAEGKSIKEIAYIPEISCRTVRFHQYRIMEELKLTTNAQLVQYAIQHATIFLNRVFPVCFFRCGCP